VQIDGEPHTIMMPNASRILHVGSQQARSLCFWADVITGAPFVPRVFQVFGTGHDLPLTAAYLGTVQQPSPFVWHLVELERHGQ
jgi:hypothetical protein